MVATMPAFATPAPTAPYAVSLRADQAVTRRARRNSAAPVRARRRPPTLSLQAFPTSELPRTGPGPGPGLGPGGSGRSPDYYANVGSVIDGLREFYPLLLTDEPDLTYFSRAVIFADSTGHRLIGHDAYRAAFWMIRAQALVFLTSAVVQIQSLYYDDSASAIYLRWRVQASPRVWALVAGPGLRGRGSFVIDGMSVYALDHRGMVMVHQLENSAKRRSGLRPMWEDILAVGTVHVKGTPVGAGAGAGAGAGVGTGYGASNWFKTVYEVSEFAQLPRENGAGELYVVGGLTAEFIVGDEQTEEEAGDDAVDVAGERPYIAL